MIINDVCTFGQKSKIKAGDGLSEGKYKFFTSSSEVNKFVDEKQFDIPGIIMGTGGNATLHYSKEPFSISTDCIVLFPKTKTIETKYLYYYLLGNFHILEAGFKGAGLKHTSKKYIGQIKITNIPSKDRQLSEVDILDDLIFIIDKKKEQIKRYDQLIKSRFVEMFGDEHNKVKLEKIAKIGSSHRVFVDEFVESGVPFYRGTEIGLLSQGITDFKPYYISKSRYNELTSDYTKPEIGDILMPSICNKGQLWIVNTIEPFYYKDGRVLSIRPDKDIVIPEFLHYFLKIKLTEIYKEIATGATFAEFKIFLLKDIDVVLPTICKQKKFTDVVQQVDKLKFVVQKSLDETQKLFDSLMQEYFG